MLIHGGLPLYDENLPISEYNKPRATHAETYDFIEKDLEKAAELLPLSWPDTDLGNQPKPLLGDFSAAFIYMKKSIKR